MGQLSEKQMDALETALNGAYQEGLKHKRLGRMVLSRETCDWVIDEEADTAMCRTHGEIWDGVDSAHFPGAWIKPDPLSQLEHRVLQLRRTKTLKEIGGIFSLTFGSIWRIEHRARKKLSKVKEAE